MSKDILSEKLKPCPFCGNNVLHVRHAEIGGLQYAAPGFISCECGVRMPGIMLWEAGKDEVANAEACDADMVRRWNTRKGNDDGNQDQV
jgi:hypothetical protein